MKPHFLISTNYQRVLSLLVKFSDKEFYEREIARKIGISYGSANKVLNELYSIGILNRIQKGKMYFYRINVADPVFQQFKILNNLILLRPLVDELKDKASKIVLFGSCAEGTDSSKSDMDIFITSDNKRKVLQSIDDYSFKKGFEEIKIHPVIFSPLELLRAEKTDKEFLSLVNEGIILWEKIADESGV